MDSSQEDLLTNGADCPLHYHSIDRQPTHDTLAGIQQVAKQVTISTATYAIKDTDDYVFCTAVCTITLPRAKSGREIEIVKSFAGNYIIIIPTGTDTVQGTTSVTAYGQWSALHFKAISNGWILI